ncbi:MAG: Rv3235 family protein [Jatrophihabitantaceae bacterium]
MSTTTTDQDAAPIRRIGMTMTLRSAPRREPPLDDERPALHLVGPNDRRLPLVGHPKTPRPDRMPPRPDGLPDPSQWGRSLMICVIETAAGRRPLHQLAALFNHSVAAGLGADFERAAASSQRHWLHAATVRTVHASRPREGVAELSATIQAGRRIRAVALRLEAGDGRWRCTRLQLG